VASILFIIAAIRYRKKAESCTKVATPQLNAGTRDYGRGSLSGAIGNVTMSFNGGGEGEDGSISGAPKCFEHEGPLLARKKNFATPHILTHQSYFQFMCHVIYPKIILFPQDVFIYFVCILKERLFTYTTLTDF
jgi:hypothetical protein